MKNAKMDITITIRGAKLSEQEIDQIVEFSRGYGDVYAQKCGQGNGAIDLLNIIEIKLVEAFLKGLLGEDYFKKLGARTLDSIVDQIGVLRDYCYSYYKVFVKSEKSKSEGISIKEEFEGYTIYAVLNDSRMTEKLANDLAAALVKTFALISLKTLTADSPKILQLYPNFLTDTWDYIFTPTTQAFGKFIDRYYDLKDEQYYLVNSAEEFIDLFGISDLDEFKFIISSTYHMK